VVQHDKRLYYTTLRDCLSMFFDLMHVESLVKRNIVATGKCVYVGECERERRRERVGGNRMVGEDCSENRCMRSIIFTFFFRFV